MWNKGAQSLQCQGRKQAIHWKEGEKVAGFFMGTGQEKTQTQDCHHDERQIGPQLCPKEVKESQYEGGDPGPYACELQEPLTKGLGGRDAVHVQVSEKACNR